MFTPVLKITVEREASALISGAPYTVDVGGGREIVVRRDQRMPERRARGAGEREGMGVKAGGVTAGVSADRS